MVFSVYFAGILGTMAMGRLPGVLAVIIAGVLLSNVRAAFLASEWRPVEESEDKPMRFNETFADKLSDQLPAKLWPVVQIPFFALASVLLLLELLGAGVLVLQRFGILHGTIWP
jgi:NADH:ubiquinone oxidoreductase subunit 6 (subunit J)